MRTPPPRHALVALPAFLVTVFLAFQAAHADPDDSVSILYYESIQIVEASTPGEVESALAPSDGPATIYFDAYGRRFELQQDEAPIITRSGATRMRGRLTGQPDSWFSLLRDEDELSGIISDGGETYLVEPRRRVAELLIEPPTKNAPINIIFRLADTLVPQGLLACPIDGETAPGDTQVDGQSALVKLSAELQAAPKIAATADNAPLLIGVVADKSFVDEFGVQSDSEIDAIFNRVEGIYQNEANVELAIDSVFSVTPGITDPFSDTVVGPDLLDELGEWRSTNQTDLAHTHLLTKRRLVNDSGDNIAGIAFLGQPGRSGVCTARTGAGLSRHVVGLTSIIVAHEIGHNLGAPHDGDPVGACATAPESGFIMAARISIPNSGFSDCSIAIMNDFIGNASCLTTTAQTTSPSPGGGGGGGALGYIAIPGLLVSLLLRRRRHRPGI